MHVLQFAVGCFGDSFSSDPAFRCVSLVSLHPPLCQKFGTCSLVGQGDD